MSPGLHKARFFSPATSAAPPVLIRIFRILSRATVSPTQLNRMHCLNACLACFVLNCPGGAHRPQDAGAELWDGRWRSSERKPLARESGRLACFRRISWAIIRCVRSSSFQFAAIVTSLCLHVFLYCDLWSCCALARPRYASKREQRCATSCALVAVDAAASTRVARRVNVNVQCAMCEMSSVYVTDVATNV